MRGLRTWLVLPLLFGGLHSGPAFAHSDPESGAQVSSGSASAFSAPATLDGKTFADPHVRIFLRDNAPSTWSYNGSTTSISAAVQFDVALTPAGPCPTNPTGTIDIRFRAAGVDPNQWTPWKVTNWFDKSGVCTRSAQGELWHWDDSLGIVGKTARDFELQLVDRTSGSVYLDAFAIAEFVQPNPPSNLAITSTSSIAVNLQWRDNSLWDNHTEIQRAGASGDTWTTLDRVTNSGTGTMTYQDYVPFPISSSRIYRYRVRAVSGDKTSTWTPAVATSAPAAPSGFAAELEPRQVTLRWNDTTGEDRYEIERSQDGFATLQSRWVAPENAVVFVDSSSEGLEDYQYRIRAINGAAPSAWSTLQVATPGLMEPLVPELSQVVAESCSGLFPSLGANLGCIRTEMHAYAVYTFEVEICETENGVEGFCSKYLLATPEGPEPHLPNDDDPAVPPPGSGPDDWVPPSGPGEEEWMWIPEEGTHPGWPTPDGKFKRLCAQGTADMESLHWDGFHVAPKPPHWGWTDCWGKIWEMAFEWTRYGNEWHEYPNQWWDVPTPGS